jgi:hypothetical protein
MKIGTIVTSPTDDHTLFRELRRHGRGSMLMIGPKTPFLITVVLAAAPAEKIEQGDYMAVIPGRMTFYLLPKATAEEWAAATEGQGG